jgi:hypothetical protein
MNGGLSLEHYDASKRDPTLAAMMLSKINNGALGGAGDGVPEKTAQQAWLESTREQAAGATDWFVSREDNGCRPALYAKSCQGSPALRISLCIVSRSWASRRTGRSASPE